MRFRVVLQNACFFVDLSDDGSRAVVTRQETGESTEVSIAQSLNTGAQELRLARTTDEAYKSPRMRAWLSRESSPHVSLAVGQLPVEAEVETERDRLARKSRRKSVATGTRRIKSLLPGVIRSVRCTVGESVAPETPLVTLEAMKMENELRAEIAGTVVAIYVTEGQVVQAGDAMLEVEPAPEAEA